MVIIIREPFFCGKGLFVNLKHRVNLWVDLFIVCVLIVDKFGYYSIHSLIQKLSTSASLNLKHLFLNLKAD